MARRVLKTAVILNILLVVIILALRLLPNNDISIRTLLLPPDGCAAPCFMNIRAGVTDMVEASAIVKTHTWSKSLPFLLKPINDMSTRFILWQWSGKQSPLVDTRRQGQIRFNGNQAVGVIVQTTIPLGAVWLALGATDKGRLALSELRPSSDVTLTAVYPAASLLVRVTIPAHSSQSALWLSRVEMESSNPQAVASLGGYALPSFAKLQGHS
ncbi:MAG: hypothetical protein H0X30_19685 [Anaerolineae bacterium]|nr:hypothetical protein [Anaerolineae bacterium]